VVALAVERGRLLQRALEAEALRRSDELRTALLRGVSHDFRSPLTAIATAADALERGGPMQGDAELVRAIRLETARLERLVDNLLDLSRLESGALSPRLDWCDPEDLVAGALREAIPAGRPSPAVDVDADLPLVRADAALCERILVNLLHNAARHGAPPVRVIGRAGRGRVEVEVRDAGPGIAHDIRDRMFEPFARGRGSEGTGLGLALARGLAEAQDGSLVLVPSATGCRMVLSLPAAEKVATG
jgi:two-component system sensor histidine kinase KdpD